MISDAHKSAANTINGRTKIHDRNSYTIGGLSKLSSRSITKGPETVSTPAKIGTSGGNNSATHPRI